MVDTEDPIDYFRKVNLPKHLINAEFGGVEGKVVVVTGAGRKIHKIYYNKYDKLKTFESLLGYFVIKESLLLLLLLSSFHNCYQY